MLCIGLIITCTFFFSDDATQMSLELCELKDSTFLYSYASISFQFGMKVVAYYVSFVKFDKYVLTLTN